MITRPAHTISQSNAVSARGLTKRFGAVTAVDHVDFDVRENTIYGLLGRNGAGKTTLMQLLTGQDFATSGNLTVFGASPVENATVLSDICFIKESQKYPDEFRAKHVFASAPWFFKNWDASFAAQLIDEFAVPLNRSMKKLSRGQLSAVGVIVGLASRARLTFFDEPYLGLDAVARQIFYDQLLSDYSEHPRTVILSTHLIDEVSNLLEHVLVIDNGRILIDAEAEALRDSATTIAGTSAAVERFTAGRTVMHTERLGGLTSITIDGQLNPAERSDAAGAGLEILPVSLQQLVVRTTNGSDHEPAGAVASGEGHPR